MARGAAARPGRRAAADSFVKPVTVCPARVVAAGPSRRRRRPQGTATSTGDQCLRGGHRPSSSTSRGGRLRCLGWRHRRDPWRVPGRRARTRPGKQRRWRRAAATGRWRGLRPSPTRGRAGHHPRRCRRRGTPRSRRHRACGHVGSAGREPDRSGDPLVPRHDAPASPGCCAASRSLNAIAISAAREPGPLVTRWRSRPVANVDSTGSVVRRWRRDPARTMHARRVRVRCPSPPAGPRARPLSSRRRGQPVGSIRLGSARGVDSKTGRCCPRIHLDKIGEIDFTGSCSWRGVPPSVSPSIRPVSCGGRWGGPPSWGAGRDLRSMH